jgi:hypothetical protein
MLKDRGFVAGYIKRLGVATFDQKDLVVRFEQKLLNLNI